MTEGPDGSPPTTSGAGTSSGTRRPGLLARTWSVALGTVAVVALRAAMSTDARYPRVVADETAYLAMARWMAGGERWDLGLASTYGPAYSVLLAPWFALGLSPDGVYRAAIVTNVVLAGLTFLAFESLARRIPGVTRPLSSGLALVAASLPALVATTNLAWSDDLAPLTFAVLVLCLLELTSRPRPLVGAATVGVAVVGYAVHGRFLPLAPVVLGVLVVLAVSRRLGRSTAAAAGAALVVGLGLVQLGSEVLHDRLYDPEQVTQGLNEADRITRLVPLLLSGTGQLWYLLVTTAGVAGIGLLALGARTGRQLRSTWASRPVGRRVGGLLDGLGAPGDDGGPAPLGTLACLALVLLGFVTSVVFMTDRPRGDHLVYGRYNDLFVGPLVLGGLAVLARRPARVRTATLAGLSLATTALTAVVLWRSREEVLTGGHLVYPVLGLVALDDAGPGALPHATVVALALGLTLAVLGIALPGRARPVALVAVTSVLCVVGSQRAVDRIDPDDQRDPRGFSVVADVLGPDDRLAWVVGDGRYPVAPGFYRDQLYTPETPSVRLGGTPWRDGEPFLITGATHPGPPSAGYRLAWVDPGSELGLWVAPGPRQDALADAEALLPPGGLVAPPGGDDGTVEVVRLDVEVATDRSLSPTDDGGHIEGLLRITPDSPIPWATHAPGGPGLGRVRVSVAVEDRACLAQDAPGAPCLLFSGRVDIERWVPADAPPLDVPFRLATPPTLAGAPLQITFRLLREGDALFGEAATTTTR